MTVSMRGGLARASGQGSVTRVLPLLIVVSIATLALLVASVPASAVSLPDGRAWELVSPPEKNSGDIEGIGRVSGGGIAQASATGEAITYVAEASFGSPEGASANQYISTRHGPAGWSTQNITTPAISGTGGLAGAGTPYKAFSFDLSLGLVLNGEFTTGEKGIENPPLPVSPGEPEAPPLYQNFYVRNDATGSVRPLLAFTPAHPAREFYMHLEGTAADLRHVIVSNDAALTSGAVEGGYNRPNLYEWADGTWQAVNVLPGQGDTTTPGATLGSGSTGSGFGEGHTISNDGSRVFWSNEVTRRLYVRENGATTVQIDAPQGGPVSGGEQPASRFRTATGDGTFAFFTSSAPLTGDANTGPQNEGDDLYRFDVTNGVLIDLTADPLGNGAEVRGVIGASEDGSYVYFVANGQLTGPNREGRQPTLGADNLYVWHEAGQSSTTAFIGTLAGEADGSDWSNEMVRRTTRVAQDGRRVVFDSTESLTGYNNVDASTQLPDEEVYLYDVNGSPQLTCVSCNPNGARPIGPSHIPAGTPFEHRATGGAIYQSRGMSEDGTRVFFDSEDGLVAQDTNGQQDVYEYENGHTYLLSGGTSDEASEFLDASASGDDVFFITRKELIRSDTDQLVDLYDARVGGGIPESQSPVPCTEEGCHSPLSPVGGTLSLGSAAFRGLGNVQPAPVPTRPGAPIKKAKKKKKKKNAAKGHRRAHKRNTLRRSRKAARASGSRGRG